MARDLTKAVVASPNQASRVFGVGGAHPVRMKNLFIMRFLRRNDDGGEDWRNGLSFFVKSIERPSVQPQVEEVNQYNKKRVVHTGVKYNPISCSLYDTADNAAMMMWAQYSTYYFGDYRQNPNAYKDDIINESMLGDSAEGYGYTIGKTTPAEPEGINSQFFFDKVEVYQVWGGEYTTYQLINPKITNFTPDELDYEQNAASMIQVTLQFEGIFHDNGGKAQLIRENDFLTGIFGAEFSGETFDPDGFKPRETSFTSTTNQANQDTATRNYLSKANYSSLLPVETNEATTSAGGALSKFGSFDFGNFKSLSGGLPSEVSSLIGLRDATQAALGSNLAFIPDVAAGIEFAAFASGTSPLDQVSNNDTFLDQIGSSPFFAFEVSGEGDLPPPAPVDAVVTAPNKVEDEGLSLSSLTIATVNNRSNGRSQIGYRSGAVTPPISYLREPKPATQLTPDLVFGRVRVGFNIQRLILGTSANPTIVATLNRPIPIRANINGECAISGMIAKNIVIAANVDGDVAPSVSIEASIVVNSMARASTTNRGLVATQIVVASNARAQAKVSGAVLGRSVIISSNIQANISLRSGTLNKVVVITPSISGIGLVVGDITKSINIVSTTRGFLTVDGSLTNSINISAQARGSYYDGVVGSLTQELNITSNIRGRTVAAGINRPVIITMQALGSLTPTAFTNMPITVSSNIIGYQVAGDGAGAVVMGAEAIGWHLFGNADGTVVVESNAIAYLDPTGFILDPNFGFVTQIDTIQLFGTQDSAIIIPINMSGFILTQQHYLTGDMRNTAQDTLELSGDASDGDDWLNHSGDN